MGCFDRCLRCLSLVPWASLIATVICWAGTALFCGTGHEALTYSYQLLNDSSIPGFSWNETSTNEVFQSFKYAIYGIAGFMFILSLLLFIDGVLSTRTVKSDFEDGCKTSCCGLCVSVCYTIITYITSAGWLVMTCFAGLPVYFYVVAYSRCQLLPDSASSSPAICIDFVQTGIMHPSENDTNHGRLCGDDLKAFCDAPNFNLTYQMYVIAFVGSALVLLSMKQYLMCLSANFAYIKMTRKLAVYEDAKYREEMELNDIINTARSNERLTHKYS